MISSLLRLPTMVASQAPRRFMSTGTTVRLNDVVPNFQSETQFGKFDFYDYIDNSWAVLFSHPADFTPICTTELGMVARRLPEFTKRGVKVVALSIDTIEDHKEWIEDVKKHSSVQLDYPIIADGDRSVANLYNMLDDAKTGSKDDKGLPVTVRTVYIIGPDKRLKLFYVYPPSVGRNFDEIFRAIDALQVNHNYGVVTPVDWKKGQDVIIPPSVSDEEAKKKFGDFTVVDLPSGKKYLRYTSDPSSKNE